MRVQVDAVEQNGVRDLVAHHLDAQVLHETGRLQVDVLRALAHGGHVHRRHTYGVFRGVEVGEMGRIGELDLQRDVLSRLIGSEIHLDIVNLGVQVRELQHVIDGSERVGAVLGFHIQTVLQIDGLVAGRGEIVEVEHEHFQKCRHQHQQRHRAGHPQQRAAVHQHEMLGGIGYVLAHGRHRPHYREIPHPRGGDAGFKRQTA